MSEKRPQADQTEPPEDAPPASEESHQTDAERAAEIADEKEKSGAETVV
jgi:hypothetical protein